MPTSMLDPSEAFYIDSTSSCTYAWLIKYFKTFSDVRYWFFFEAELLNGLFRAMRAIEGNKCDFDLMLSKCDKRQFQTSILPEPINLKRVKHNAYFIQLCFFGSVLVSLIGLITNGFFGTVLILMSHLSYIAFTLNRIALLGKEHGKIVNWMSTISLKRFLLYCFIISVLTSIVKIFKYQLNFDYPAYEYPVRFTREITFIFNVAKSQVYLIADFLCDFIISFVYVILQLIVDIGLAYRLKKTLESKMTSGQTQKQKEQLKKKNNSAINRAIVMVILNATLNITLKAPTTLIPIYDMISFKFQEFRSSSMKLHPLTYFHVFFCGTLGFCTALEELAKLLFLISLTLNIFFFYNFDKTFKICFQRILGCFSKNKSK